MEDAGELNEIENVYRPDRTFTYCQVPFVVRVLGLTVGITREDQMLDRCMRLHGLKDADEESMQREAAMLSTTWLPSPEEATKQHNGYPRIPAGEAIVAAPLGEEKFEPGAVSVYANPALAIPCYGERALGQVADDEIVIALPPGQLERALSGLEMLARVGLKYPVGYVGGVADVVPVLSQLYSDVTSR